MEAINKKKTIQDLPEETIENILSHLSSKSLKAAALTCKRWNEISSKMGWKLKLNFENERGIEEPWVEVLLKSNRNFKSIQLYDYAEMRNNRSNRLMKFFEKHGGNVQNLVMWSGELHHFIIFCDVLSTMPNLKKISFIDLSTQGRFTKNFFEDHLPNLQKLETLYLYASDIELLKYFKKTQINSLEIIDYMDANEQENVKILLDFLIYQKNLKCFDLVPFPPNFFSEQLKISIATENFTFKLKELTLDDSYEEIGAINYYNMLKFFEFHSDTIERLELGCSLPDFLFECIFSKFKRLASLTFNRPMICPNDEPPLYERFEINTNIKVLNFPSFALSGEKEDVLKEIFKHVPNVEMLRTNGSMNLHEVLNVLTRLKHLVLYGPSQKLHQIKSQSLQSITIDKLEFTPDWEEIAANNPNVHTIEIKNALENSDIVKLLTNVKLRHLYLPMIEVDSSVCKALREHTEDMKSLRIHKASFVNCQENLADVKCLRFHENESRDSYDQA
ncbi:CLUMA_CG006073, isoform A [Clunio marinus]|uniref:CLUMA_CG006073, isoform A n=1 Tax=Clunio marinus TaxID=568069 RepID=A0A1J1I131_9DIPT|nr:CLUMA_CG006073, isoform A [Clunio marinus]